MRPGSIRVGQGFDVHPWSEDDDGGLVLGGIRFPEHRGLRGHSDGDAIAHACTDAVLGAAGLGDIGQLFPDTDAALAGADSVDLLAQAVAVVRRAGWAVANIDCTVVCDSPKIGPVRDEMIRILSGAAGAPVTVKGKRTEGVDALGQGIQAFAVAMVVRDENGSSEEGATGGTT